MDRHKAFQKQDVCNERKFGAETKYQQANVEKQKVKEERLQASCRRHDHLFKLATVEQ